MLDKMDEGPGYCVMDAYVPIVCEAMRCTVCRDLLIQQKGGTA